MKIVNFVFSLLFSNAITESWRKDRNMLGINTLEAALMVKYNYSLSCSEFAKFLKYNKVENMYFFEHFES